MQSKIGIDNTMWWLPNLLTLSKFENATHERNTEC
jgi:hypothetical protein